MVYLPTPRRSRLYAPGPPHRQRSFLGLCSYYRRFVRDCSDIARPLYKLTEGQREFRWTSECEDAFRRLKALLTTAPILAFPTTDGLFILDTDASNTGLGVVLSQVQGGGREGDCVPQQVAEQEREKLLRDS